MSGKWHMTNIGQGRYAGWIAWRIVVRWFDMWIGVYKDPNDQRCFIFPIPCVGVEIRW